MKRINVLAWTGLSVLFLCATSCRKDIAGKSAGLATTPRAVTSFKVIDNVSKLSSMVSAAHAAGTKALLSVGGGGGIRMLPKWSTIPFTKEKPGAMAGLFLFV
jgi:hypothetical protein